MTTRIEPFAVRLGGTDYPITSLVSPEKTAVLPSKIVTGEFSMDNDPEISSWVINDQTGGIGKKRIASASDNNRCWFSNCNLDQRGHITAPRSSEDITGLSDPTTGSGFVNLGFEYGNFAGWTVSDGDGAPSTVSSGGAYSGTYFGSIWHTTGGAVAWTTSWTQTAANPTEWRGRTLSFSMYVKGNYSLTVKRLRILVDGASYAYTDITNETDWTLFTVSTVIPVTATAVAIQVYCTYTGDCGQITFDGGAVATVAPGLPISMCQFNGELYIAYGRCLTKLTSTTAVTAIYTTNAAVTAMISSLNGYMYIGLGDTENYLYMSTAEAITATNVTGMTLAEQWDNKLFKMTAAGVAQYATTPNSATPSWTGCGSITDLPSGAIEEMEVAFDADGNDALYAATNRGLKVLDFTNSRWVDTILAIGDHPNGGVGTSRWRDGLYVPVGLEVINYNAATRAITSMGLNKDDSLPDEYNGEIVGSYSGYIGRYFVSVGADQASGTNKSGVYAYTGDGWHCWWYDSADDSPMGRITVSSAQGVYRLYFANNGNVKAIPVPRGVNNPKRYGATYSWVGNHVTPWFDAGWPQANKVALAVKMGMSFVGTGGTISVYYRTVDPDILWNSWSLLDVYDDDGYPKEYIFTTGQNFKQIQFWFQFNTSDTSATADLEWFALQYKVLPQTINETAGGMGYHFRVDCSKPYGGKTPSQLIDALIASSMSSGLVELSFRNDTGAETYYGTIKSLQGAVQSGVEKEGQFDVFVIVP